MVRMLSPRGTFGANSKLLTDRAIPTRERNTVIRNVRDKIAELCLSHSGKILLISALVLIAALAGASRLSFDPDILNLVPQNNREINEFKKVLHDMGTIDYHIVVVNLPAGHDVSEYDTLIQSLAGGYRKSALINDVDYRIPNPLEMIDLILPRALLFLTPAELNQAGDALSDQAIRDSVARNRTLLQTPQSMAMKDIVRYDPFHLLPIFMNKFKTDGTGFHIDVTSGYYLSADHTMLLILTKPKRPAQDVPFATKLMAEKESIERNALKEFKATADPGTPIPKIGYSGGYEIAHSDAELIRSDAIANIIFSFFGVLALFLFAFRRFASVGYGGIPLSLGLAMTFGVAGVIYGQLSSASAGFAALLAGLGIDFITVMYGRYVDERNRGAAMEDAIRTIMRSTLPGVFVAAITTAGTFYAFLATDFRGMTQLGFLTGTGILFFLVCVTFLLPSLIVQGEKGRSGRAPKLYLHSFGSEHLIDISVRRPMAVTIGWIVFCVLCGVLALRIRFSDNIQDLRARGNSGILMQEKIAKKFGQSFDFMMLMNEGRSVGDVLDKTYRSAEALKPLVANRTIASYQSISTYLPPEQQQREIIRLLREGRGDRFNPERINATLESALRENGFRPEAYDHYMELFSQALTPSQPIQLSDFDQDDSLARLVGRFIKKTPDGFASVIYIYPTGGRWPREVPPALLEAGRSVPGSILTGVNLASGVLRRIVKADATRATLLGLVIVAVLMLITFRSIVISALTFVPFVAGGVGMLGLMALMNLQFNFMNVFVGLMIIGCGSDYAVYIIERFTENPDEFEITAAETGKAVVMAALTSIVGYGSFALSHYPGLRSIGYASTFGVGLSGLASITLLPAILVMMRARRRESRRAVMPS